MGVCISLSSLQVIELLMGGAYRSNYTRKKFRLYYASKERSENSVKRQFSLRKGLNHFASTSGLPKSEVGCFVNFLYLSTYWFIAALLYVQHNLSHDLYLDVNPFSNSLLDSTNVNSRSLTDLIGNSSLLCLNRNLKIKTFYDVIHRITLLLQLTVYNFFKLSRRSLLKFELT